MVDEESPNTEDIPNEDPGTGAPEPSPDDGYKCSCGYITDTKGKFAVHLGHGAKNDGPGVHKSLGRVNMVTGEITMPPWNERTTAQKEASLKSKRVQKFDKTGKLTNTRTTELLAQASEIKFIPRIYTTTYTPIMQAAQDAAVKWFGWRPNMPFENFTDTVFYLYFKEHGIELGGYIVSEDLVSMKQETEQEAQVLEGK